MILRIFKMITVCIGAIGISGCFFLQGPLLSAPSDADDLAARHNHAEIQAYKQQQWDRAKNHFEEAITIAPSLAEAHYNLGMVLYRQAKDAEAKPHFLKAAALAPDNDVIQSAPPFEKGQVPYQSIVPYGSGSPDGHGHRH